MIAIIDYQAGNITSVVNALARLGEPSQVTSDPEVLRRATKVIFPGQGAAGPAMARLREMGLVSLLKEIQVPFLGICLGLQLLFESSEENEIQGLGVVPGRVTRLEGEGLKIPHMGWNTVEQAGSSPLFASIPNHAFFYFVHSYAAPLLPEETIGVTRYGIPFTAAFQRDNIFGVQFHPEKSGDVGLQLLSNFMAL